MEKITRDEARKRGLSTFFTGAPCRRGHIAERRVINCACKACTAEYGKKRHKRVYQDSAAIAAARARVAEWAKSNPERYRKNQSQWRKANREKVQAYNIEWRRKNGDYAKSRKAKQRAEDPEYYRALQKKQYGKPEYAEKAKARTKKWRRGNKSRAEQNTKKWKQENPGQAEAIARAGWMNRRVRERQAGKVSARDVRAVMARHTCEACGALHEKMEMDHFVALSRGGTNDISNLRLLCRPCNRSKWAKDADAWEAERRLELRD